jgi:hypothetical protein
MNIRTKTSNISPDLATYGGRSGMFGGPTSDFATGEELEGVC